MNRERKFRYGSWDCCLFVAGCIEAMTGVDIAEARRDYSTRAKALRGESVDEIVEDIAADREMPEVPVLMASRGDMVLIKRPRDYSLGLMAMNGTELLIALRSGYGRIPLSRGVRAWKV